jgi:phytoene/squalene synthetase
MPEREPPAQSGGPPLTGEARARSGNAPRGEATRPAEGPKVLSPSRYLAWLYSAQPQQPVLAALCEIESEIAGSLRAGIDHQVAHARLQWWQEECERAVEGRPVHPLTRALVNACDLAATGQPSPLAGISGFVGTAVWDLAGATFETRKELTAYCERWGAAMFETAAARGESAIPTASAAPRANAAPGTTASAAPRADAAAGTTASAAPQADTAAGTSASAAPRADTAAGTSASAAPRANSVADTASSSAETRGGFPWRAMGAAAREIELLVNLVGEAHTGRLRIPLDELERAGVDVNALGKPPWPSPLTTLLQERHVALRATLAKSLAGIGREEQARFRGLLVWAALAWQMSARAERSLPYVIQPRRYYALADGWRAWRAARRAVAGHIRLG